jgi:hypothetical protein
MLAMVNLSDGPLEAPRLGIDLAGSDSNYLADLMVGGYTRDPLFGGSGPAQLLSLPINGAYATTIPDGATLIINALAGQRSALNLRLGVGETRYVTSQVLLTGDYNGNGIVDSADYTVWRNTLGQSVPFGSGADGDGDGEVTRGDYIVWNSNFGQTRSNGSSALSSVSSIQVPEPASPVLFVTALAGVCCLRRRMAARTGGRL